MAQQRPSPPLDGSQKAVQQVERLSPDRFRDVPSQIRQRMLADRCRIPQAGTPRSDNSVRQNENTVRGVEASLPLTNVISGEFAARGQRDWAALCSSNGRSTIRVYWGGSSACAPAFEPHNDVDLLEGYDVGSSIDYGFAASLERMTISLMRATAKKSADSGEPLHLPPLTHDALGFARKPFEFYYCDRGKWSTFVPVEP